LVQAIGRRPQQAPEGAPVRYLRHRPEQTTPYCLVLQHAASFVTLAEASAGSEPPRFIKDEFKAFLERGILAHGFMRLRCGERVHDKLLAFSRKRRGFCPSCGARRMSQTAAHLVDHVIPHAPVFGRSTSCANGWRAAAQLLTAFATPTAAALARRSMLTSQDLCSHSGPIVWHPQSSVPGQMSASKQPVTESEPLPVLSDSPLVPPTVVSTRMVDRAGTVTT
jgi:Transposase zinc-binding domain